MGEKNCTKNVEWVSHRQFCLSISPMVSCTFRGKQEAEVLNKGTFRILFRFLSISYVETKLKDTTHRKVSYPYEGVIFENIFYLEVINW